MKLISYFDDFLLNEVNLTQTKLDLANQRFETIKSFIENSSLFSAKVVNITTQGSFKHKTIIRPVSEDGEFDVDVLVEIKKIDWWIPQDYINNFYNLFYTSDRYKDIIVKNTRCVTLDYSGDFHMDIVPCIKDGDNYYIFNSQTNQKEVTDWYWYASWFKDRDWTTNGNLKKVVRLLKYIRDYNMYFDIKSVLLTTLIARAVKLDSSNYSDIPTTLKILVNSLKGYLYSRPFLSQVNLTNPVLPTESFNRHITQEKYSVFRTSIIKLDGEITNAYNEENLDESKRKWSVVFWEKFSKSEWKYNLIKSVSLFWEWERSKWIYKPEWKILLKCFRYIPAWNIKTRIEYKTLSTFPKNIKVKFLAEVIWINWPYEVYWKVLNTWAGVEKGNERGDFFIWKSENEREWHQTDNLENWETISYTGTHWIQCYIIKNDIMVWKSEKFYVVVV